MQMNVSISDENLREVAEAFGYMPNPCDPNYPTAGDYVQFAVTDYVRQMLSNYRARLAAAAEMTKQIQL